MAADTTGRRSPTDSELDEMYEHSKNDHWIWVGSDIRILVAEIRALRASRAGGPAPDANAPLPPEIVELLRDVASGPCTPDLRGRAGAALVRRDLVQDCSRCGGSGYERIGDGSVNAWGVCEVCRPAPAVSPRSEAPPDAQPERAKLYDAEAWDGAMKALGAVNEQKDGAYRERDQVVALLARMALALGFRAGVGQHEEKPGEAWDADWRTIVFIDLPAGQVSWHFHDSERHLLASLPPYPGRWDGHDTPEKYRRVNEPLADPRSEAGRETPRSIGGQDGAVRWDGEIKPAPTGTDSDEGGFEPAGRETSGTDAVPAVEPIPSWTCGDPKCKGGCGCTQTGVCACPSSPATTPPGSDPRAGGSMKIALGTLVRDRLSGYRGHATGRLEQLNGATLAEVRALRASPPARETAADTRRAWLRNSLRSCAEHERKQAAHCRKAHRVEPYRSMSHEMADAHDEAAAVFERRLTAEDIR